MKKGIAWKEVAEIVGASGECMYSHDFVDSAERGLQTDNITLAPVVVPPPSVQGARSANDTRFNLFIN